MDPASKNLDDFAEYIGASRKKAQSIVESGEIESFRIGGSIRLRQSDIEAFVAVRRQRPDPENDLKRLVHAAVVRARAKKKGAA